MNYIYKKKCRGIWKSCVNEKDDEKNVQQWITSVIKHKNIGKNEVLGNEYG